MGGGASKDSTATRVVILGGGYGGTALIKALDAKVAVTLIEVGAVTRVTYNWNISASFICHLYSSHHT
jgi:2-phospho-L-lactate transferase/gluconeogenesis factor (CofD/UPF0052 family)